VNRQAHWDNVYQTKGERDVSWFQESPDISLDLIRATGVQRDASIIDIGGGASRLVDALAAQGFSSITVLDLSEQAFATSRARLGARGQQVRWIVADVTTWRPSGTYALWHDRAAFHFLTEPGERAAYAECLRAVVAPRGHVIIGTFAPGGPERCSGLPVMRHDAETIGQLLGPAFTLVEHRRHEHVTPGGGIQRFQFTRLQRSG
jgi:SAM-dependent methyltransferase